MTAEEIRASKNECDNGAFECARWMQEIAAQLADANEAQRQRTEKANAKSDFLDELIAEIKPFLPKIADIFDPPTFGTASASPISPVNIATAPPVVAAPANASPTADADAPLIEYLQSQGHDLDKAKQILANHGETVRAEFEQTKGANDGKEKEAAPTQEERAVPQT